MWDDEDNNPYGSFSRRDSDGSDFAGNNSHRDVASVAHSLNVDETDDAAARDAAGLPNSTQLRDEDLGDDDQDTPIAQRSTAGPKKDRYDSRVEQILYENPQLDIQIVQAGKNTEGGGGYITYAIRTGDIEVRRRYKEFASLRETLVNLHPTLIIPPIPEKHSISDYAAKPTRAKEDQAIIELRQRMLTTFLNRCRRMPQIQADGVWWRFLDPNASWSEVLNSHPVASIPKNNLKAPPLDPAHPSTGHAFLPIPSTSAKLRSSSGITSASGTPIGPSDHNTMPSAASHSIPGLQVFTRFPPETRGLSESELDPYFVSYESASKDLETLLQGPMERVNQRMLLHLYKLHEDQLELGAKYNAFSLSEQSQSVAQAIEKIGQACDSTSIRTKDLSSSLSAQFSEPMREGAQFAGVVRSVLRYRILKRVQEEMTRDELERKKNNLSALEQSEQEAKRIQQYLDNATSPRGRSSHDTARTPTEPQSVRSEDDTASVDSDFPPTAANAIPSADQGAPQRSTSPNKLMPTSPTEHKRAPSGSFVKTKIFGRLTHAIHGVVDADPERARRDQIGKTKESLGQLEQALEVSEKDVKDASAGVMQDLERYQGEKEEDLRRYMMSFARCHIDWAKRSLEVWEEAKTEVDKIDIR